MPDGLEFVDLAANVLRVLFRVPGTLHLKFFAVARPGRAGLIHGSLKGNDVAIAIVEDAGLGMIQSTVSPWMIRASRVIQGQGDADFEEPGPHHPRQRPEPLPRNLIFFRAPARRQAQTDALFLRGRKVMREAPVKAAVQRLDPSLVGGNVLGTPGGACDQAHRRTISTRQISYSEDEGGQA